MLASGFVCMVFVEAMILVGFRGANGDNRGRAKPFARRVPSILSEGLAQPQNKISYSCLSASMGFIMAARRAG